MQPRSLALNPHEGMGERDAPLREQAVGAPLAKQASQGEHAYDACAKLEHSNDAQTVPT